MKSVVENNVITIYLEGRIDSNNSTTVEREILDITAAAPEANIVLNAENLEYISSAGLRVLMKLRKQVGKALPVLNVSKEVYDIFDVTGFTDLFDVHRPLREISIEGCEVIGQGGFGTVYRLDPETIVKVYRPGTRKELLDDERSMSQRAFRLGVPTAIAYDVVKCGESYGLVFEMLNARTVAEIIAEHPEKVGLYATRCAGLLKEIHAIDMQPGDLPDCKRKFISWAEGMRQHMNEDEVMLMLNYLRHKVPDGNSFLHGDFHCKNLMEVDGELMLIDIGDATMGHPVFDLGQILFSQIIMPKTTGSVDRATQLLGFSPEVARQYWGVLAASYFGTSDPGRISRISAMLTPLALFGLAFHATRYTRDNAEATANVVDRLIRGQLLPSLRDPAPIDFRME